MNDARRLSRILVGSMLGLVLSTSAFGAPVSVNFVQSAQVESGFTLDFGFPGGISNAMVSDTEFELEIDPAAGTARFVSYHQQVDPLSIPTPAGPVSTGDITVEIVASLGGTFDRETGAFVTNDVYAVHFTGDLSAFGISSPFILPSSSAAVIEYDSPNTGGTTLEWDGESELGGAPFRYTCNVVGDFTSTNATVYMTTTYPPNGAVDARQPHLPGDPATVQGWNAVDVNFNSAPGVQMQASDFLLGEWGADGTAPAIVEVQDLGDGLVRLLLDDVISSGAWTTITHVGSGTSLCLASLPGDVNGDGAAAPSDVLAMIDCINATAGACAEWSTDIDRSGEANPADILRVIDLLNGAASFDAFNGMTLGDSPCF